MHRRAVRHASIRCKRYEQSRLTLSKSLTTTYPDRQAGAEATEIPRGALEVGCHRAASDHPYPALDARTSFPTPALVGQAITRQARRADHYGLHRALARRGPFPAFVLPDHERRSRPARVADAGSRAAFAARDAGPRRAVRSRRAARPARR